MSEYQGREDSYLNREAGGGAGDNDLFCEFLNNDNDRNCADIRLDRSFDAEALAGKMASAEVIRAEQKIATDCQDNTSSAGAKWKTKKQSKVSYDVQMVSAEPPSSAFPGSMIDQKLEKNRLSAKQSRLRKKNYLEQIEKQLEDALSENAKLKKVIESLRSQSNQQ